jgi:hypothetical protein
MTMGHATTTGWLGQYHVSQPKHVGKGRGQDAADLNITFFRSFQHGLINRIITCMLRITITTTLTDSIAMLTSSEARAWQARSPAG